MARNICVFLCCSMLLQFGMCQFGLLEHTSRIRTHIHRLLDTAHEIDMIFKRALSDTITKFYELFGVTDDEAVEDTVTTEPPPPNNPVYHVDLPEPPVCGISDFGLGRIVNGENAKLGAFPWMALLSFKVKDIVFWPCGGSLVSSRHVLTAAHCIHPTVIAEHLSFVRLGELDYEREDDGATPIDLLVVEKIKHEKYDKKAKINDIALLVLEREVSFTELIKPICLPRSEALRSMNFERYTPFVAGWGKVKAHGASSTHLQVLQLPVLIKKPCIDTFSQKFKIDESVLCVGYQASMKDSCEGDSGGPLMLPLSIDGVELKQPPMHQIGLVSYGVPDCGRAPGVYTKITHFVPWIEEKITGKISQ